MSRFWNPPMIPGRDPRSRSRMQTPCPSQGRKRRYIRCENFSIPDAGDALSNTWSIGRVTARRKGPGSTQRIFWIPVWWRNSTETTRKDRPPDHVVDPGVDHLLPEPLAGGGLCHAERSYGSLSWSSTGTITRVLVWLHLPAAPYLVLIICQPVAYYLGYLTSLPALAQCEVLFALANISERFPSVTICVLPGLLTLSWSFAACLTDPACLLDILSVCRCPDPLLCLCLRICLAYVALDTTVCYLPVWPPLCINKAADGSPRHWPVITIAVIGNLVLSYYLT